eukprot:CAMPEP_0172174374 /NCGR_PEP_ID=MMETSP1050-20130122/13624_1 /TAXON_ID=233186 /ORGANISM="Cryptomonas curvata, Strain CCAP979/52" /LENGTH=464 /DNA_ID=CAMNT_0012846333 /DNA_START=164 /DNA_END=1555 /DNA_ORIENTATION=-
MRMTDFQKKQDCEQEIADLRHENQILDERREKAVLELLQVQKDSECAVAILRQECQFAEQRIAELSARESDLTYRLEKLRRESGERILSLEQEIKANDQHLLDIEARWEAKFGKQAEALTVIIESKQEEMLNLQLRCLALSDRVESAEQDRDKLGKELSDLKSEVRQRLREDESKLREGGEEYERILLALNAEKSQLRHSLELAAELESRQQRQIEELTTRVREGETRERTLEAEVQRSSILVTQSKENEKQLQRRLDAAAGQAGIRKDDWEAERTQLEDSLTALKTELEAQNALNSAALSNAESRLSSALLQLQGESEICARQREHLERLEVDCAQLVADHASAMISVEEKYREKLREQREGWEAAKKELQSSHEVQVQTLEATYQNQIMAFVGQLKMAELKLRDAETLLADKDRDITELNEALEELEQEKGKELATLHAALDNHRRIADQERREAVMQAQSK